MQEPPDPGFERYLAEVDRTHPERPRYCSGPFRWWYPLPAVLMLGGAVAFVAWWLSWLA
ncbi:hypothetical protein [Methylorubrum sp. SB2]|uniref:hypothetical protein n=1 Tax=Methylorubrum subtropicum TaxID=3138812 RepID=UPI00313C2307